MNKLIKTLAAALAVIALLFAAGCSDPDGQYEQRKEQARQAATKETLEKKNLQRKLQLEEDANRVGYVYLMSFGKFVGYYTVRGKISSNGSQIEPEDLIECPWSSSSTCQTIDGPQDDGTYGEGDPGVFFFTTEDVMVTTSLDYMYSTQPVPNAIGVPKLN
jgi:hypothetical protein